MCRKKRFVKVSGILIHHGPETDVTRCCLGEARAFSEHIKQKFRLNFSKNKCSEICSMHNFSWQIRFRVRLIFLFRGGENGQKRFSPPNEIVGLTRIWIRLEKPCILHVSEPFLFENFADNGYENGNYQLWLNQPVHVTIS